MANDKIVVEIKLDDGSVQKGFATIEKNADDTASKMQKSFSRRVFGKLLSSTGKLGKSLAKLGVVGSAAGLAIGAVFTKKSIDAARVQEDAVNSLRSSLSLLGETARLPELEQFASSLQSVTKFGDEAILSQLSFAQAMGASTDQSKDILTAATDMSAALNIDLNSAVRNISKTLGGYAGELGEVIPELKNLSSEQLKNGEGIALLAKKYKGFAGNEVKTFSGATQQLSNTFGDMLEGFGNLIIKSPALTKAVSGLSKVFGKLTDKLANIKSDVFKDIIIGIISFGQAVNKFIIAPLEFAFNTISFLFNFLRSGINSLLFALTTTASKIVNLFAPNSKLAKTLKDAEESTFGSLDSSIAKSKEGFNNIFNFDFSASTESTLNDLGSFFNQVDEKITTATKSTKAKLKENLDDIKKFNEKIARTHLAAAENLLVGGAAAIGTALAKQTNIAEALAATITGILGNMLIDMGKAVVLGSTAMLKLKAALSNIFGIGPQAGIIAGLALITFGSALKALSGSAGGAAPTQGGGLVSSDIGSPASDTSASSVPDVQQQTTSVAINVEGTVLDPVSVGEQISAVLQEAFDAKGTQVVTA